MGLHSLVEDAMFKRLDELRECGMTEEEAAEVYASEQTGVRTKLLEADTERMVETINALIDESGGEHFGLGDLRPLAAELIDYTLNREFGVDAALDGSQAPSGGAVASKAPTSSGWCDDPNCRLCRKEAAVMPKLGQCPQCPYKLNGVFAQTGCPNCPNREAA